jgi:hypothetical protein
MAQKTNPIGASIPVLLMLMRDVLNVAPPPVPLSLLAQDAPSTGWTMETAVDLYVKIQYTLSNGIPPT